MKRGCSKSLNGFDSSLTNVFEELRALATEIK